MTELEIALPMYWNTLAKHLIPCRLYEQMDLWGRMWAHNMLVFERMHVLLKGMVRSGKNMTASVAHTYGMYSVSQSKQRFNSEVSWANEAKSSSLSCRPLVGPECRNTIPLGIKSARTIRLPDRVYAQLLNLWGTRNPAFLALKIKYLKSCVNNQTSIQQDLCNMHTWKPSGLSEQSYKLLQLQREAKVYLVNNLL
jgi:hypothetical protein